MFETTIAGSLPKPAWLAEPEKLWPEWRLAGELLETGKRDAAMVWLNEQDSAGIDTVSFDRAGFRYHGRVKALADAAREAGLKV